MERLTLKPRFCSSGSQSLVVVPSSTLPRRVTSPAMKSIASESDVFPVPLWPIRATLRILSAGYSFIRGLPRLAWSHGAMVRFYRTDFSCRKGREGVRTLA